MKKILNFLIFVFIFFVCISFCKEYNLWFICVSIFISILGSLLITKYLSKLIDKWSYNQAEKMNENRINELIDFINNECNDILILEKIKKVTDMKISNFKKNNNEE
ncbi:MAG: hypothetical protein ACLUVC_05070 [Longibaculum sp.]